MKFLQFPSRLVMAGFLGLATLGGVVTMAPPAEAGVHVGIYVPVAPPPPRREYRPVAPGPRAVWVPGYWRWTGHGHVWVGGVWRVPPRRYHEWVPGHWRHAPGGWVWIDGHWR